jgi:hypothetical protein
MNLLVKLRILRNMLHTDRNGETTRVFRSQHPRSTASSTLGNHPTCDGSIRVRERMLYRACLPLMVLAFLDNQDAAVPIRPGDVFEVLGPAPDDRFDVVDVKGEEFLVFASDLKRFAAPVEKGTTVAAS